MTGVSFRQLSAGAAAVAHAWVWPWQCDCSMFMIYHNTLCTVLGLKAGAALSGAGETSVLLHNLCSTTAAQQRTFLSTLYFTFSALRDTTFKSSSEPTYLPVATTLLI
jgi:hypothetical protein